VTLRAHWVMLRAPWVTLRARWVTLRAHWVMLRAPWVTLRARWAMLRAHGVMLRARWVTLGARWVMLRAPWVTLRALWAMLGAHGVMLRARWVTLRARWVLGNAESSVGCYGRRPVRGVRARRDGGRVGRGGAVTRGSCRLRLLHPLHVPHGRGQRLHVHALHAAARAVRRGHEHRRADAGPVAAVNALVCVWLPTRRPFQTGALNSLHQTHALPGSGKHVDAPPGALPLPHLPPPSLLHQ
jgi:hypothetical protein